MCAEEAFFMTSSPRLRPRGTVGELLRRRLQEIGRSPEELAEAVAVPAKYIDDLIAGDRRPPLPERTDIYPKMTSFLQLGHNDVVSCARAERADAAPPRAAGPGASVRGLLLALCEPATARQLEQRRARRGGAELAGFIQRLLDVTQGAVRRVLDDQIRLRLAAVEGGSTYLEMRFKVLEFLDATADTLTAEDLIAFLRPRIARWDVDLETGVLRVVLQPPGSGAPRRFPKRDA
jgi:hypothetical protein